jgi:hypothetical protein
MVDGQPVLMCCFLANCPGICYKENGVTKCDECGNEEGKPDKC